jgi:bifunctional non-homologous end joining protein LigD
MGTIEFHPWGCAAGRLDVPDRVVIDLDPGPDVSFDVVAAAAREVRARFAQEGLPGFVKSTGGKGLHVCAPLDGTRTWHDVASFSYALALAMERDSPARFTTNIKKAVRQGRIFVDFLRNMRGSTSVASFSPRARPGAPVSVPLSWEELATPPAWTVLTAEARAKTTPWEAWPQAAACLR